MVFGGVSGIVIFEIFKMSFLNFSTICKFDIIYIMRISDAAKLERFAVWLGILQNGNSTIAPDAPFRQQRLQVARPELHLSTVFVWWLTPWDFPSQIWLSIYPVGPEFRQVTARSQHTLSPVR